MFRKLAIVFFEKSINDEKKSGLEKSDKLILIVIPTIITVLGYTSYKNSSKLWILAVILLIATVIADLIISSAIDEIDGKVSKERDEFKVQAKSLGNMDAVYAKNLYIETVGIAKKLINLFQGNGSRKGLYTYFSQAIVWTMEEVMHIPRTNYQILIYGYNTADRTVQRVEVQTFVTNRQSARTTSRLSIDSDDIKNYYYANALLDNSKTIFSLKDNKEIAENFYFIDQNEDASQYSQYVGVSCRTKNNCKVYFEIIAYYGLRLDADCGSLEHFAQKVIVPYTSLLQEIEFDF